MKKTFTHFPFFYILITFYPLLFLWAQNISQVDPVVVVRPFIFTLIGSAILYGILYLIFRDGLKAALVGSLLLVAFFSYGHVYYGARAVPALKTLFHNSTLIPLYLLLFGLAILGVLRLKKYGRFVLYLNIISLFLVGLQAVALSDAYIRGSYAARQPVKVQSGLTLTTAPRDMPDIYVIVLDTYMRSDALEQDLGYDNSPFVGQLTNMGFYVVACSRPNYTFTYASIAALLNMRYIPQAYENTDFSKVSDKGFWSILKNDEVRQQLKSVGYSTVAFQEEYPSLQFNDLDILIGMENPSINSSHMYPFEIMYRQSTAAIILDALDFERKDFKIFPDKVCSQKYVFCGSGQCFE